jgi:hypothetical protein
MTVKEMVKRFDAYNAEVLAFTFGEWLNMSWAERDAHQAEIDSRHNYKHGWIIVDGESFNQQDAYPDRLFVNSWD